jgi:hypothetical protein
MSRIPPLYTATGAAGVNIYFAFLLENPFDFVSNPVMIGIVP